MLCHLKCGAKINWDIKSYRTALEFFMVYGNDFNYRSPVRFQSSRLEAENNINNWNNVPKNWDNVWGSRLADCKHLSWQSKVIMILGWEKKSRISSFPLYWGFAVLFCPIKAKFLPGSFSKSLRANSRIRAKKMKIINPSKSDKSVPAAEMVQPRGLDLIAYIGFLLN